MADEGDVDVLGDFDFKLEAESAIYDANELPSESANLLPEYTNPPWMLEQGWNLDMDEKSKATIEKMLLEEQQYLGKKSGKPSSVYSKLNSPNLGKRHLAERKRCWSEQEKQLLQKGMEIYGRRWTKIAELIPNRTSMQIKAYAHKILKVKAFEEPTPVNEDTSAFTTGKPTIPVRKILIPAKGRIPKKNNASDDRKKILKLLEKAKRKKQKPRKFGKTKNEILHSQGLVNGDVCVPAVSVKTDTKNHKVTITPDVIENIDGFCPVTDIVAANNELEADEDDIDIENDIDSEDTNPVLQSRSTSPNSVYEKLISDANLEKSDLRNKQNIDEKAGINRLNTSSNKSADINNVDYKLLKNHTKEIAIVKTDTNGNVRKYGLLEGLEEKSAKLDDTGQPRKTTETVEMSIKGAKMTEKEPPKNLYVNAITTTEGEIIQFPIPVCEKVFSRGEITDEERSVHSDFFSNKSSKTPDRYLKIRNHIIDSWRKCRPNYLNKTSVRSGLKNCGDVNCIGRIHAFLECIGAINFGCEQASYNVPKNLNTSVKKEKVVKEQNLAKLEAMRPRKRKVRDEFGYWIDEKELEGKTIEHPELSDLIKGSASKATKPKQTKSGYDPFKLVPCQEFTDDNPAPFHVEVKKSALIVMDIHAHICKTEVIGMLGGTYCCDQGKLIISMATPCKSISTGMQCEMDPVSQTQASEEIRSAGLKVIGWYHSHPVFDPNPSVRDMETQLKFQDWFSKGGANFVGIIVSPYNARNLGLGSEFNCLTVTEQKNEELQCNTLVPYKFDFTTTDSDVIDMSNLAMTAQDLATSYSTYRNRVDLMSLYRKSAGITCLDKLIESVRLQFASPDPHLEDLIDCIRKAFVPATDISDNCDTMVTETVSIATEQFGDFIDIKDYS